MANENIVAGLFGLTPSQIRQRQQAELEARAQSYAQMSPFERASAGIFQGAGQLGGMLAERMGGVNAEVADAQRTNALMQGDTDSPQGLRSMADRLRQSGDLQRAFALAQLANKRESEIQANALAAARTNKENMLADEAPKLRHEEKLVELAQKAEAAKLRSEDSRLATEQRMAATREANALRLEIARLGQSAREDKQAEKAKVKEDAKVGFASSIDFLEEQYRKLDKLGGIVNPDRSGISNIGSRIASSEVGQFLGGAVGTDEQVLRNQINGTIPLLVLDIKNVTGASAQQMNSNIELQNFLRAASNPKTDIKTVLQLLKNLKEKYHIDSGSPAKDMHQSSQQAPTRRQFKVLGRE